MARGKNIVSFRKYAERRRRRLEQQDGVSAGWLEAYRRIWEESLDRLNDYLQFLKREHFMDDLTVSTPANEPLIIMTRSFAAPRLLVWKVFTQAEHIPHWWGMRNTVTRVEKLDLRPGGVWRYSQQFNDGNVLTFQGTYLEVIAPEKLVNTFGMVGMYEDKLIVESHTFEETAGRTIITSTSRLDSVADRDAFVATGMEAGTRESYNRIEELLATL